LALSIKYNVSGVNSGNECIEKFIEENSQGNKIQLILLDYKLGDMLGDSVAKKIKERNGTQIILISAYNLDRSLIEELEENKYITKYVQKPISMDSLMELVVETVRAISE
jgi:CheY-like chemotaxis protein